MEKVITTIHYEIEGSVGEGNAKNENEVFNFKSIEEQTSELRATITNLIAKGYAPMETPEDAFLEEEKEEREREEERKEEQEEREEKEREEREQEEREATEVGDATIIERYFRRTEESILISVDTDQVKTQVNYGTEGSVGKENTQTKEDISTFNSMKEQTLELNKTIENVLNSGFIETKPQKKYPYSLEDFEEDEEVIEKVIDSFEANEEYDGYKNTEHFSLIAWSEPADGGPDKMLEYFIDNKKDYQRIKHFTFGNMDYELCEMSWIQQSDYGNFFKAFPKIKSFSVQGSMGLVLGKMDLPKLEILEVIGSGTTKETLTNIMQSNLPNLKKINIFLGDDEYGGDVTALDIKEFLANTNFTNLINLGICNAGKDLVAGILEAIIESKYAGQIKVLDISKSVSSDADAQYLLENIEKLSNIKYIDLYYNFFSSDTIKKLEACPIEINALGNEEPNKDEDGNLWNAPMYTE